MRRLLTRRVLAISIIIDKAKAYATFPAMLTLRNIKQSFVRHQPLFCALLIAGSSACLSGCASSRLTRQDVLRQYDELAEFDAGVQQAKSGHADLLVPDEFSQVEAKLEDALQFAKKAQKPKALRLAEEGNEELLGLSELLEEHRDVMGEVLDVRERAIHEGAQDLMPEQLASLDREFRTASAALEEQKVDSARAARPRLIEAYAQLELECVKRGTVERARIAIEDARANGARSYAPKTFNEASEEAKLVTSVLSANRNNRAKADEHAHRAIWLAHRAKQIALHIKRHKKQRFSREDEVLWFQDQFQQVRDGVSNDPLPFDQESPKVVEALLGDTKAMQTLLEDLRATHEMTRTQITTLEQELARQDAGHRGEMDALLAKFTKEMSEAEATRLAERQFQAEQERQRERQAGRLKSIQELFSEDEAVVLQQGDDLLIRLKGFHFPPNRAIIESGNFGLLSKVVAALAVYPQSNAIVSGHTDDRGNDQRNLDLSIERAISVVKFLTTVGGVSASKVQAVGKGESEPITSNDTREGRAVNRRIDVVIKAIHALPDEANSSSTAVSAR